MDLKEFRAYLVNFGIRDPSYYLTVLTHVNNCCGLTEDGVSGFLFHLLESGRKMSTVNRYKAVIKAYGRFKKWKWVEKLEKGREVGSKIALLSDGEIEQFLSLTCPPDTPINSWKRWTLFYSICAYTGMRMGEVARLEVEDVDFNTNNFDLWETKTATPRRVPIPDIVKTELHKQCDGKSGLIFAPVRSDLQKQIMLPQTWRRHFLRRIALMGIKKKYLRPYSFRHSYATSMMGENISPALIKEIMGHRDIRTTMWYTHLVNKSLQRVINKHPTLKKQSSNTVLLAQHFKELKESGLLDRPGVTWKLSNRKLSVAV